MMETKVNRVELMDAITTASKAVWSRSPIPAITHLLLQFETGRLLVSGTNVEISITCAVDTKGEQIASVTVPPTLLNGILPNLSAEDVVLVVKNDVLEIAGVAKIKGLLRSEEHTSELQS